MPDDQDINGNDVQDDAPQNDGSNAPDGGQQSDKPSSGFTQEDVDRIIKNRLSREREKVERNLLSQLGVENVDDLKAKLETLKATEQERLTEKQRLEQAKEELSQQLAEAQAQIARLTSQLRQVQLERLVESQAYGLGFADPGDAVRLLDASTLVGEDDDALPGQEDVKKALEQLAERKKYLLRNDTPTPPELDARKGPDGGRKPKPSQQTREKELLEAGKRYLPAALRSPFRPK